MQKIRLVPILFLLLLSCQNESSETASATITQQAVQDIPLICNLYVRHMKDQGLLRTEVKFYNKDSIRKAIGLIMPGPVICNGQELRIRNTEYNGQWYINESPAEPLEKYTFTFKDIRNEERSFEGLCAVVKDLKLPASLNRKSSKKVSWSGGPLVKNEKLLFVVTDSKNKSAVITVPGPTSSNSAELDHRPIANLSPGKSKIYAVRKRNENRSVDKLSIRYIAEMYTATEQIGIE